MTIINEKSSKLGAEVGSIFLEFGSIQDAQLAINKVNGRIYDGNEIKTTFIDEDLYTHYFFTVK